MIKFQLKKKVGIKIFRHIFVELTPDNYFTCDYMVDYNSFTRKIQYTVETDDSDYYNYINVAFSMKEFLENFWSFRQIVGGMKEQ